MKEIIVTMTNKGRVTIPAEIRRRFGIGAGAKLIFVIEDDDRIELRVPTYATVASLQGAAGSLKQPLSWEEMRALAREDQANAVMRALSSTNLPPQ